MSKPFEDFIIRKLESEKNPGKKKEGAQKKSAWSDIYYKKGEKKEKFYIKKSQETPADNLSEVITSNLLGKVICY